MLAFELVLWIIEIHVSKKRFPKRLRKITNFKQLMFNNSRSINYFCPISKAPYICLFTQYLRHTDLMSLTFCKKGLTSGLHKKSSILSEICMSDIFFNIWKYFIWILVFLWIPNFMVTDCILVGIEPFS